MQKRLTDDHGHMGGGRRDWERTQLVANINRLACLGGSWAFILFSDLCVFVSSCVGKYMFVCR